MVDGVVTYSAEAATVSSVGSAVQRTYSVVDDKIRIATTQGETLSCAQDRLSTTYYYKVRSTPGLSAALERALAGGASSFKGVPTR